MRFVLDASVALKWVLVETDTADALRLRADVRNGVHDLLAPDTFPVEVAHALTRAERRGLIAPGDAALYLADVLTTAPSLRPSLDLLARAVELSSALKIGVYDCLYVALAEVEQCRLLTADGRLINSVGAIVNVTDLSSLP